MVSQIRRLQVAQVGYGAAAFGVQGVDDQADAVGFQGVVVVSACQRAQGGGEAVEGGGNHAGYLGGNGRFL